MKNDLKHGLDPVAFAKNLLDFHPDPWQEQVLRYQGDRLILLCARQTGKSTVVSVRALHEALFNPGSLTLLVSPSQRQSSELFKKIMVEMGKLPEQPQKVEDNRLSCTLKSGSRIVSLPSAEGTIRGYSAPDLIVIDEAARLPSEETYLAIRPMLGVSRGTLILLSTPAGRMGFFHTAWESEEGWEKIKVLARDCPRISEDFLKEELETLGSFYFRQEYEVEFLEGEQSVFRFDDIMAAFTPDVKAVNLWGAKHDQSGT